MSSAVTKNLLALLLLAFSFSCQKKSIIEKVKWSPGDKIENLQAIESHEWSEKTIETDFKTDKIILTQQNFRGIPVEESFLKRHFETNKNGTSLKSVEAAVFSDDQFQKADLNQFNPNLILKNIKRLNKENSKLSVISTGSVYKTLNSRMELLYKVSYFDRRGEPWSTYANLKNKIVQTEREGSHFGQSIAAEALVFPRGPKLSSLTEVILENLNLQPTLSNTEVVVTSEADRKITSLDQSIKFDPKDLRFDQVQAFYYLNKSLDWMKTNFGLSFPNPLEVVVHVGFPEKTNTAFYYQNKIRLGAGDDVVYSQISHDPSIVSHESFHYLIDQIAGLPYQEEGGSLNEAFSDFFTCLMLGRPLLGESAYMQGPFKRTLEIKTKLNEKTGGLYHDSLIISGLLWEISQKIGTEKSINLALDVLKKLNRYSDFSDFNSKLNETLKSQFTKDELLMIQNILKARGFNA